MNSLRILIRRIGNRLTAACPDGAFNSWLMKKRIAREGGKIDKFPESDNSLIECTHPKVGRIVFRDDSTDALILYEVLWRRQYERIVQVLDLLNVVPSSILDGGANIGSFTLFAAQNFPSAKFICVEPDEGNCTVLQHNIDINKLSSAVLVQGAIWPTSMELELGEGFRGNRERELSFSVSEVSDSTRETSSVKGYAIEDLAETHSPSGFDVIKLDIEGAEAHVLSCENAIANVMDTCRLLVLEIHDEVYDRFWFSRVLSKLRLTSMSDGELTYVWRDH